jgi:hypothetical protein
MKKIHCVVEMVDGDPSVILVKTEAEAMELAVRISKEACDDTEPEIREKLQQTGRVSNGDAARGDWSVGICQAEDQTDSGERFNVRVRGITPRVAWLAKDGSWTGDEKKRQEFYSTEQAHAFARQHGITNCYGVFTSGPGENGAGFVEGPRS